MPDVDWTFVRKVIKFTFMYFVPFTNYITISLPVFFFYLGSQHLLAQWMCSKGDYRSAMTQEKEALTVFTSLVSVSV